MENCLRYIDQTQGRNGDRYNSKKEEIYRCESLRLSHTSHVACQAQLFVGQVRRISLQPLTAPRDVVQNRTQQVSAITMFSHSFLHNV
jgi:hypothetical protein